MKTFTMRLDPRLATTLDRLARERGSDRMTLIRDVLYTHAWNSALGQPRLRSAPIYNEPLGMDPGDRRMLKIAPDTYTSVLVDQDGLVIEEPNEP